MQQGYPPERGTNRKRFQTCLKALERNPSLIQTFTPEDQKLLTTRIDFYNKAWYMVLGSIPVSLYYSYKIRVDPANTQRYFTSNSSMGVVVMCIFGYGLV